MKSMDTNQTTQRNIDSSMGMAIDINSATKRLKKTTLSASFVNSLEPEPRCAVCGAQNRLG
jgi:hypothetical protein